jgi:hypothetical protein
MDVLAVRQVTAFAKKYALEHGPIILELDTYRCGAGRVNRQWDGHLIWEALGVHVELRIFASANCGCYWNDDTQNRCRSVAQPTRKKVLLVIADRLA